MDTFTFLDDMSCGSESCSTQDETVLCDFEYGTRYGGFCVISWMFGEILSLSYIQVIDLGQITDIFIILLHRVVALWPYTLLLVSLNIAPRSSQLWCSWQDTWQSPSRSLIIYCVLFYLFSQLVYPALVSLPCLDTPMNHVACSWYVMSLWIE